MPVRDYRDLVVWQAAMTLAEKCYEATKAFPRDELFGMTAQIRRASASIPANIAEGRGRQGKKGFPALPQRSTRLIGRTGNSPATQPPSRPAPQRATQRVARPHR